MEREKISSGEREKNREREGERELTRAETGRECVCYRETNINIYRDRER